MPYVSALVKLFLTLPIGFARLARPHYPGDILGGAVDGLTAAAISTALCHVLNRLTQMILQFASFLRLA